jgi:hypothetical protein
LGQLYKELQDRPNLPENKEVELEEKVEADKKVKWKKQSRK